MLARLRREAMGLLSRVEIRRDFPYRPKRSFYWSMIGFARSDRPVSFAFQQQLDEIWRVAAAANSRLSRANDTTPAVGGNCSRPAIARR